MFNVIKILTTSDNILKNMRITSGPECTEGNLQAGHSNGGYLPGMLLRCPFRCCFLASTRQIFHIQFGISNNIQAYTFILQQFRIFIHHAVNTTVTRCINVYVFIVFLFIYIFIFIGDGGGACSGPGSGWRKKKLDVIEWVTLYNVRWY